MTIHELKGQRAKIVVDQRALLNKAEAAGRNFTVEEEEEYGRLDTEFERLGNEIRRLEVEEREAYMARPEHPAAMQRDSFNSARSMRGGDQYRFWTAPNKADARTAFNRLLAGLPVEQRALQASDETKGGYLAPAYFVQQLIQALDSAVLVRQFATVIPMEYGTSLHAPALDTDLGDPTWTAELATGDEDTVMDFGQRELNPHPLARRIKVSNTLLRQARLNPEDIVRQRFLAKFSQIEENAFMNGDGAGQPLGLFAASDQGISTSRDVSTGNTTTAIAPDNLFEVVASLKPQYHANARWIFHRTVLKTVRQLKDGEGQYLWQPGLVAGQPDQLIGFPVHLSEWAPYTMTAGLYVGLLGDLSSYWIADSLQMEIAVLKELYAEANQTGFIGRLESDGMPVLEEAFVRVTLAP